MILDRLENAGRYFPHDSDMARAIRVARDEAAGLADGTHWIENPDIKAIVQRYETQPAGERRFEAHRIYADVQVMLEGRERQDVFQAGHPDPDGDYDPDKDIAFFKPPSTFSTLLLEPGCFAVYMPQDLHRPNCAADGEPARVRKVCVKVRVVGDTGLEPVTPTMSR